MPRMGEWVESPLEQGADEEIIYTITTTNWVSSPTNTSVKAYDTTQDDEDVTTTVFPTNTPTEASDVITLSELKSLTINHSYRIEVKFAVGGQVFENYGIVNCTW